jgi:hypothetical protein
MSCKIILSDLEKSLFPEYFPYFKQHFLEDLTVLKQDKNCDDTAICNIRFKLKTVRHCLKAKNEDVRSALNQLFNVQVEQFYDWNKNYDWHELKSILVFFVLFSDAISIRELEKIAKNPHKRSLLHKYLPEIKPTR